MNPITIPNSVTKIGKAAFYGCTGIYYVTIPNKVTEIEEEAFGNCGNLRSVYISNGVTTIGVEAFAGCRYLTTVTIPNSVTFIGGGAFNGCDKLKDVYCYAENVPNTRDNPFSEIENVTLHVPAASVSAYQAAEPWKNFKEIVELIDYHPLLEEGKIWEYGYNNGVNQYMKRLSIGGDTIINNQTYKAIINYSSKAVEMFLREEGKKVYCCYPYQNTEILLYDFGKNAGEIISKEIKNGDTRIRKVISVDTILYKAIVFRCMTVHEYFIPQGMSEEEFLAGNYGYESGLWVEGIGSLTYLDSPISYPGNYYSFYQYRLNALSYKQKDILDLIAKSKQQAYHPFIEEGKVWKVGISAGMSNNQVKIVKYYYFDGDTIIDGKTCKQMMCQQFVSPDYPDYALITQYPLLNTVGAWYEEDKKVYIYNSTSKQFKMMYDFSLDANDILHFLDKDGYPPLMIGPNQTGGLEGFKGVYRDIMMYVDERTIHSTFWLEGVGSIDGPTANTYYYEKGIHETFLMSCTIGDEIIYLNYEYEDGATPESMGARKNRFDFTHTIKTKPKARKRSEEEPLLYGEYNDLKLGINLNPLDDAYQVRITDDSGKIVYEKAINAGNIVGLNIDISAYSKGRYTVTVENSDESFTGEFNAQGTGIVEVINKTKEVRSNIYNLQGQRLSSLQKGLNIVNGQKIFVK